MPVTINPTPPVNSRCGAPMGRTSNHLSALIVTPTDPPFTLQRVRIDRDGYDSGGAYWGLGKPLYWWYVEITEGDVTDACSGYFRARDRDAAKAHIRALQKHARFFR